MHEASIATALLQAVLKELPPKAVRVERIELRIGVLAGIERRCLAECFAEIARGTKVQGAVLDCRPAMAQLTCRQCGAVVEFDGIQRIEPVCRQCGGPNRLSGGSEMTLQNMEVQVED